MIAAIVVFVAGIALAVAQPGDLGGKKSTNRAASSTTKPSSTGSTTGSTTGTTGTSVPGSSSASSAAPTSSASSSAPTSAPPTTANSATPTTVARGGLNQGGASGAGQTHPITGGTSMLALGLLMIAAAFALRRLTTA